MPSVSGGRRPANLRIRCANDMNTPSKNRGQVQVYTGDGKGKTTAALGLAIRAAGAGLRPAIVYFDKGGSHYFERHLIKQRLAGLIDFFVTGLPRFDPVKRVFRFGVTPDDLAEARRGLDLARGLLAGRQYDLVVLDEAVTSIQAGLLDEADVLELVRAKPPETELVLTGRGCPPALVELADLVSEVRDVKHYLRAGVPAREGLDY